MFEDGDYLLDASNAQGWRGPSGLVELVTHENFGQPWQWCYWLPIRKYGARPRCGIPLSKMRGAVLIGPIIYVRNPLPTQPGLCSGFRRMLRF